MTAPTAATAAATRSSDFDDLEAFRTYRRTGSRAVRDELIEHHRWLAVHCARRFDHRGEPFDDLAQVALIGVVKAVERFDPERGTTFATFAVPTIMGELRRHFRDATWPLKVPRVVKELSLRLNGVIEELSHELGRSPTLDALAASTGATVEDVIEALDAARSYRMRSLDAPSDHDDAPWSAELRDDDDALAGSDARLAVRELVALLPPREREIVYLRYFRGLTQSEIAAEMGLSQVHVSRLLRNSLERLHDELAELSP